MRRLSLPLLLGLGHGVADGAAGLLLGGLSAHLPLAQVGLLVLLYNALAFACQPLVGLLTDQRQCPRLPALLGLAALALALPLAPIQPVLAVTLCGLGSAAYHVGGGALALLATPDSAAGPGMFAAPGVIGLALGGGLVVTGHAGAWPLVAALLLVLAVLVARAPLPLLPYAQPQVGGVRPAAALEGHDLIMIGLLAAIALRSAVWSTLQFLLAGHFGVLLAIGAAASVGKVLGALLADRVGWRRWTVGALVSAIAIGGIPPSFGLSQVAGVPTILAVVLLAAAGAMGWALQARGGAGVPGQGADKVDRPA